VDDAHEDKPWILTLAKFIHHIHDAYPRIRIIGICFGHQIIARAFGARVVPNPAGWEIGATQLDLTPHGQRLLPQRTKAGGPKEGHAPRKTMVRIHPTPRRLLTEICRSSSKSTRTTSIRTPFPSALSY
jgi:GMP synthase-like glutamine amidotransferase